MASEVARPPLAARPAASKLHPAANRANIEADKENAPPQHATAANKDEIIKERRPSSHQQSSSDLEAHLAERERLVANREQRADEQSRAHEEKIMDIEVLEMRIKERTRALNKRESVAKSEVSRTLENILGSDEHREREEKLVAREKELAQAEATSSTREATLVKREDAQRRAERELRGKQAAVSGEHRSAEAEAALSAKARTLAAREEALVRGEKELRARQAQEETFSDREARAARLETALGERERRAAKTEANLAAQAKSMADRSKELTIREGGVTERQRQLETRSVRLATEAARLSSEASRITAERVALQAEAAELEAKRIAVSNTIANKSSCFPSHHSSLRAEDAEPTWHSVAERSPANSFSSSDLDSSPPASAQAGPRMSSAGCLDDFLRLAEVTTSPRKRGAVNSSAPAAAWAQQPGHHDSSSGQASAKSVRFVSELSSSRSGTNIAASSSSSLGPSIGGGSSLSAIGSRSCSNFSTSRTTAPSTTFSQQQQQQQQQQLPGNRQAENVAPRSLLPVFTGTGTSSSSGHQGDANSHREDHRDGSSDRDGSSHARDRITIGGSVPSQLRDSGSDRVSISSVNGTGRRPLTARKKITGRASCAAPPSSGNMTASGSIADLSRAGQRTTERSTPGPIQEAEPASAGPLARLAAPFSALRRSLGGALAPAAD